MIKTNKTLLALSLIAAFYLCINLALAYNDRSLENWDNPYSHDQLTITLQNSPTGYKLQFMLKKDESDNNKLTKIEFLDKDGQVIETGNVSKTGSDTNHANHCRSTYPRDISLLHKCLASPPSNSSYDSNKINYYSVGETYCSYNNYYKIKFWRIAK
ncbi:MAG: hypothetical protein A2104_03955 [Candidatus Melainabacteria bacterium GWF2_32_7]|nr:MAG: hypothetical protein A2104_03955 [Candidatus Melainabacteria bacterium GWF2_32_7]